jgi:hypothetical protein
MGFLPVHSDAFWIEECTNHLFQECRQCQISLNLKKCILFSPFGVLLGHIVCKQGLLVDPSKISIIVDLPPPTSVRQLCTMLGHIGYYRKFIKGYAQITTPMEKLLKKYCQFQWTEECQESFDTLKQKMVTATYSGFPILEQGISCACRCFIYFTRSSVSTTRSRRY